MSAEPGCVDVHGTMDLMRGLIESVLASLEPSA